MTNTRLLLITRRFPFFKTEAFLESEIDILSSHFENISIYPSETSEYKREVPSNVHVSKALSFVFQKKIRRAIKTVFSKDFYNCIRSHIRLIKNASDIVLIFHFVSRVIGFKEFFINNIGLLQNAVVYTYWFSESTYTLLLLREEFNLNIKIISRAHRYDIYESGVDTLSFWPYRRYCLEQVDHVFSVSNDGKIFMEKKHNVLKKISVSRLGVLDRKKLSQRSAKGSLSIVSVSRIEGLKRVDLILKVVSEFSKRHPDLDIDWTHFGSGSQYENLKSASDLLNLKNLSINLKGNVKNQEIYDFYASYPVDLFINLSTSEGIPVSIMEAQSFGIPVIATDVGGAKEIVGDENGKLLKENPSIEEACQAIKDVIVGDISPNVIKSIWNAGYNAEVNYDKFSKEVLGIADELR